MTYEEVIRLARDAGVMARDTDIVDYADPQDLISFAELVLETRGGGYNEGYDAGWLKGVQTEQTAIIKLIEHRYGDQDLALNIISDIQRLRNHNDALL